MKILLRRSTFFFLLLGLASCGASSGLKPAKSSHNSSTVADAIEGSTLAPRVSKKSYVPLSGRMDGVEFYINKDLMAKGLEGDDESFPELKSSFESRKGYWQPRKNFDIPYTDNAEVERWVEAFTGPLREHYTRWLRRGSYYVPIMEQVLKEYGLPADIVYLSMIESGYNMHAYSHANAAGPWQFIRATGQTYGLKVDQYVDERRDLLKSTRAAAAHLRDLYNQFGDWYLAFAAYNAGAGGVSRIINRTGTNNFWKMAKTRYMHPETKAYVPRILAAATIAKNWQKYGFSKDLFNRPIDIEVVKVKKAADVETLAECAGVSVDEIKFLNPSLRLGITPPDRTYEVIIPLGRASLFDKNFAKVDRTPKIPQVQVSYAIHKVKKHDTLPSIARRYKTSASTIADANDIRVKSKLKVGTKLRIPRSSMPENSLAMKIDPSQEERIVASLQESSRSKPKNRKDKEEIVVAAQDVSEDNAAPNFLASTGIIPNAAASDTEFKQEEAPLEEPQDNPPSVAAAIDTANDEQPASAPTLTRVEPSAPQAKAPVFHRVAKGETIEKIAKRYGVEKSDLKEWNKLDSKMVVKVGQKIRVAGPSQEVAARKPQMVVATQKAPLKSRESLIIHKVRPGETLWDLSRKYGVNVAVLKKWNSLTTTKLYPNQKIRIYSQGEAKTNKVAFTKVKS